MIGRRKDLEELKAELSTVEAEISKHPLASEPIRQAQEIVEKDKGKDEAAISRELKENGLPDLAELGKVQLSGSGSWWKLHRKKNKLEKAISQAQSR